MEQTLYTCDRCQKTSLVDRSYWKSLRLEYERDPFMLCPECVISFDWFMGEPKPHEG